MTALASIAALKTAIAARKENWDVSVQDMIDLIDTVAQQIGLDITADNIDDATDAATAATAAVVVLQKSVDVIVSSAEILALNATPKQLVAAPGAGKVLLLDRAIFFLDYNSAAYTGVAAGEDWNISYENASGLAVGFLETDPFLTLTADAYRVVECGATDGTILNSYIPLVNKALVLHQLSGEVADGDSPVAVRVYYKEVNLATLVTV